MIADRSKYVCAIRQSPTLTVSNLASQLRAEGCQVIGLAAGQPDYKTRDHIRQAKSKTAFEDENEHGTYR